LYSKLKSKRSAKAKFGTLIKKTIYKEIQSGAVAKSYMTNGLLIYREIFTLFLIYEEALPHI
jgi:hypothetical protein